MWSTEPGVLFQVCLQRCISLEVKCIPRNLIMNASADCISKLFGFDDNDSGVLTLLTGSPVATTPSCLDLTVRFFQLGWETPFSQNWGYDSNNWLSPPLCLTVRVIRPLFCPFGSQLFSGMPLLEMECCGMDLLSTGYICLSSRGSLFQPGLQSPFRIQSLRF